MKISAARKRHKHLLPWLSAPGLMIMVGFTVIFDPCFAANVRHRGATAPLQISDDAQSFDEDFKQLKELDSRLRGSMVDESNVANSAGMLSNVREVANSYLSKTNSIRGHIGDGKDGAPDSTEWRSDPGTGENHLPLLALSSEENEDGLPRSTPEKQGVSSKSIMAFLDDIKAAEIELHHFMFQRHGSVISEAHWSPMKASTPHMLHSQSKSVMATGVGIAINDGLFHLDTKVVDVFPYCITYQKEEYKSNLEKMTVLHLLTMTSGHAGETSGQKWRPIETSWIVEFCKIDVAHTPGEKVVYTSANSYMLSAIVTNKTAPLNNGTNSSLVDYLTPRLFEPLGISSDTLTWQNHEADNVNPGGNGLTWQTSDSLKLAMLHANKGLWHGKQIISEEWVKNATESQVFFKGYDYGNLTCRTSIYSPRDDPTCGIGYGYQWWIGPFNTAFGLGVNTQFTLSFKDQNASMAVFGTIHDTARYSGDQIWPYIWKHFSPEAFSDSELEPDEAMSEQLRSRTQNLSLLDEIKPTSSKYMSQLNGLVFDINQHDRYQNVTFAKFAFGKGTGGKDYAELVLTNDHGNHTITSGLGHWIEQETTMPGEAIHYYYQSKHGEPFGTVVARGEWLDDLTLRLTWEFLKTAYCDIVTAYFDVSSDNPSVKIARRLRNPADTKITALENLVGSAEVFNSGGGTDPTYMPTENLSVALVKD